MQVLSVGSDLQYVGIYLPPLPLLLPGIMWTVPHRVRDGRRGGDDMGEQREWTGGAPIGVL